MTKSLLSPVYLLRWSCGCTNIHYRHAITKKWIVYSCTSVHSFSPFSSSPESLTALLLPDQKDDDDQPTPSWRTKWIAVVCPSWSWVRRSGPLTSSFPLCTSDPRLPETKPINSLISSRYILIIKINYNICIFSKTIIPMLENINNGKQVYNFSVLLIKSNHT